MSKRLTAEAQHDRDEFESQYGREGDCHCHLGCAPCSSCTHPGNPLNQDENDAAWERDEPGFKRLWSPPRRLLREYVDWKELTPRGRYRREQSLTRYRRRPDAYPEGQELLTGELGRIESFRFITSPKLPEPPPRLVIIAGGRPYDDWISRGYLAGLRSGTSAIRIGMDLASGPDMTVAHPWRESIQQPVHPDWTPKDLERLAKAAIKRARKAEKLRQLSAKGAIARG